MSLPERPDRSERPELRIGDDVRSRVVDDLRVHFAAGRLNLTEFEERTAAALAATTVGDLVPLLSDLPDARPKPSGPPVRPPAPVDPRRADIRAAVARWAVLSVFFVAIWLASGANGSFWPIWPILGTGVFVALRAINDR